MFYPLKRRASYMSLSIILLILRSDTNFRKVHLKIRAKQVNPNTKKSCRLSKVFFISCLSATEPEKKGI